MNGNAFIQLRVRAAGVYMQLMFDCFVANPDDLIVALINDVRHMTDYIIVAKVSEELIGNL